MISIDTKIPKATGFVMGSLGIESIDTSRLFKGKKVLFTGVPAAFSPTCSKSHIPSYLKKSEELKECGIDSLICLSVNDPYVMYAWSKKLEVQGRMIMVSDSKADFTKSMGFNVDLSSAGLGIRSQRFVMVVANSKVKYIAIEKDVVNYDETKIEKVLKFLNK